MSKSASKKDRERERLIQALTVLSNARDEHRPLELCRPYRRSGVLDLLGRPGQEPPLRTAGRDQQGAQLDQPVDQDLEEEALRLSVHGRDG